MELGSRTGVIVANRAASGTSRRGRIRHGNIDVELRGSLVERCHDSGQIHRFGKRRGGRVMALVPSYRLHARVERRRGRAAAGRNSADREKREGRGGRRRRLLHAMRTGRAASTRRRLTKLVGPVDKVNSSSTVVLGVWRDEGNRGAGRGEKAGTPGVLQWPAARAWRQIEGDRAGTQCASRPTSAGLLVPRMRCWGRHPGSLKCSRVTGETAYHKPRQPGPGAGDWRVRRRYSTATPRTRRAASLAQFR